MSETIQQTFTDLCQQAYDLDYATDDCRDVEPLMVAIIKLVTAHPTHRESFVRLFSAVDDGTIRAPDYLVPFCMRDLRFPEIREKLIQECAGDQNTARLRRRMNYISHVIRAFDDDVWEDAGFWPYYVHELTRRAP